MTGTKPRRKRHLLRFACEIGSVITLDRDRSGASLCLVAIRGSDGRFAAAVITPSMARKLAASLDIFAEEAEEKLHG